MRPILMPPNILDHFYRGGTNLARLRGRTPSGDHQPEEWLGATVHRIGEPEHGPSPLADGTLLADAVTADPTGWLGTTGLSASDTGILVKLLDAGQRLPVHVHPDRDFARRHLDCPYGKTEAWYVLQVDPDGDGAVWVGFSEAVEPADLERRVAEQDSQWMLARLNRIPVRPGDGILVPAGTPHAIGSGVFVVEVQEPTDFSVLLEWSATNVGPDDAHLGLGFPTALAATDHAAVSPAALADLQVFTEPDVTAPHPIPALPPAADPFFRLHLLAPAPDSAVDVPAGFAVLVVLDGSGDLTGPDGTGGAAATIDLARGQVWVIPAGFGDYSVTGSVRTVLARPAATWPDGVLGAHG